LAARLISPKGKILDGFGNYKSVMVWGSTSVGYAELLGDDTRWYVYTLSIPIGGEGTRGWLQVMQSLSSVHQASEDFLKQILLSFPVILLLTGLGGLFLSDRALRPIIRITRIAQSISAGDLTRRIGYRGPVDEVGNLAKTFDQMLDHLQAAFNRERRFVSDASHELRTPLTVIKGRIGVAIALPRSQVEYENTLQELEQEVDRLIRLANALLFLARMDRDRMPWFPERLELSQLLSAIVEQVHPLAESKQITLSENIPFGLYVNGDSDLLIRVFLNLLDNAMKYTPFGGKVNLWAKLQKGNVIIGISDTGVGIPPEHLPHLFERFYRVEKDRSSRTGGTGLGLAIAKEIIRLHGGKIKVKSEVNRGTTFTVHLTSC
jgi:heavy metal sensor kinase